MNSPAFLEPDAVSYLHDFSVREWGGHHGVRDTGLLDSALNRPRDRFAYEPDCGLFRLASAYAFGIARNHPFMDGNKRTAWACCVIFLKINGVNLAVPAMDAVQTMVTLAEGRMEETMLAAWLERFMAPAQGDTHAKT